MNHCDVAIIGGGIIGLATAYRILGSRPQLRIVVLEKESELAMHQTGHNSGVLHSGIYYRPGSLKAINCRQGKLAMQQFCQDQGITYEICGKVIVAVDQSEMRVLNQIFDRGQQNGVSCELIDASRLRELEPHSAGIAAIHVPEAGIVDYRQVCNRLAEIVTEHQGEIRTRCQVSSISLQDDHAIIGTPSDEWQAQWIVNCGGLQCDRLIQLAGDKPKARIVPFRGEYFELKPAARHLCKNLIYPVPNPNFPFLGVHFTRMINGSVECGPNAVLAGAREGYTKTKINPRDLWQSVSYPGFWRLAGKHWMMGCQEMWRSLSKSAFVRALRKLIPEITADDLQPAPAGVRAQALLPNGQLVDDFLIVESKRMISVNNAPSPAATAALNIGQMIADKLVERL